MADFFLSNLKSTLDNCITELDEIHSDVSAVIRKVILLRNRKLSFREVYSSLCCQMQSKSVFKCSKHDAGHISNTMVTKTESMLLIQKYLTPVKYKSQNILSTSVQREIGISCIGLA